MQLVQRAEPGAQLPLQHAAQHIQPLLHALPDTYTAVIAEPGKEELRITRTIADGETVEWEVDVTAELAARGSAKK